MLQQTLQEDSDEGYIFFFNAELFSFQTYLNCFGFTKWD